MFILSEIEEHTLQLVLYLLHHRGTARIAFFRPPHTHTETNVRLNAFFGAVCRGSNEQHIDHAHSVSISVSQSNVSKASL